MTLSFRPSDILNMSGNLPPKVPHVFDEAYRGAAQRVLGDREPNDLIGAHQFRGSDRDRALGARFIGRRMQDVPAVDRVVVANGTQSILMMLQACSDRSFRSR
ncbi:hypothetical protein FXV83_28905 [Bradyrhizobium hipponense]|uniref:Uncharacterized protein n=1 Tax=Bradyrhizobium hipponense TaxID=2605638 RepID=A0A5S4YGG0_9BRAD|nr:hypothetical protein [Bradyrhizobium hipponense]TYO63168.1 hypothetical protein FXV83_28905 [Bradyrhizobium hipponense]